MHIGRDKAHTGGTHRVEKKNPHIAWSIFGGRILIQVMRAPAGCEWQYIVQDRRGGLFVEMFMLCLHAFVRFVSNLFALAYY